MTAVHAFYRPQIRPLLLAGKEPRWLQKHPRRQYVRQMILATPSWACQKEMELIRMIRDEITRRTGVPHVMDHIIPLNHPLICGLNVPWNLQVLTRKQNSAKSNHWSPSQLELL